MDIMSICEVNWSTNGVYELDGYVMYYSYSNDANYKQRREIGTILMAEIKKAIDDDDQN